MPRDKIPGKITVPPGNRQLNLFTLPFKHPSMANCYYKDHPNKSCLWLLLEPSHHVKKPRKAQETGYAARLGENPTGVSEPFIA